MQQGNLAAVLTAFAGLMDTKCVSPWYNRTGLLGVKHQFTYLLSPQNAPENLWLIAFRMTTPYTLQNYKLFFWL